MATKNVNGSAAAQPTDDQWMLPPDRLKLVSQSNHEISKLAGAMSRLLAQHRDDDYLMYHGLLARIQQLSELQFFALRLHGFCGAEEREEHGENAALWKLERVYVGMI